jgi:hypothetical protein
LTIHFQFGSFSSDKIVAPSALTILLLRRLLSYLVLTDVYQEKKHRV